MANKTKSSRGPRILDGESDLARAVQRSAQPSMGARGVTAKSNLTKHSASKRAPAPRHATKKH